MPRTDRIAERLNKALHTLFDRHSDLYLLGEDLADPYGGAFRVTRQLSTRHPQRVLSTPISESGIMGVANGLALCGNKVIVEVMFGDFATLAFDQLVNFATKSVGMYGERRQMSVVLRCPVGGHRGYGPTHSQSLQKHYIGVPHLSLFELSAFHDPEVLLERALLRGEPAVFFEPKLLYGQRGHAAGPMDDVLRLDFLDPEGNWAHVHPSAGSSGLELALVAPGGTAPMAIEAARTMAGEGVRVHVLVPAQLYPLDLTPAWELLGRSEAVAVAEESTAGGTWGSEVARHITEQLWAELTAPVTLLNSKDSVIPAAPHLERQVLLQGEDILAALRAMAASPGRTVMQRRSIQSYDGERADAGLPDGVAAVIAAPARAPSAQPDREAPSAAAPAALATTPVVVPKLNNNDVSYVLLSWLAEEGQSVERGQPVAEIETSKAVEELLAEQVGTLCRQLEAGADCQPGQQIGSLVAAGAASPLAWSSSGSDAAARAGGSVKDDPGPVEGDADVIRLGRNQQQVGEVVSQSRRDIPDAFVVLRACLDAVIDAQITLEQRGEDPPGLLEFVVKLLGELRGRHPLCFARRESPAVARMAEEAHVGVTLDAGNGLYVPVVRSVERKSLADIADELAGLRMQAFRGSFTELELAGANIAVSWNHEPDVILVQPVIPPGLTCAVSVSGRQQELSLDPDGRVVATPHVYLGLAHDHRLVNGREAIAFLTALAQSLADRDLLATLAKSF
jgi:pyruvate/2-oxoglutarate/acetoin dehydrogenase E1 component/pyruvate/2-oxoglutarate dehydrogenase complex dihydrolipoamide acyltransferase (E2) component